MDPSYMGLNIFIEWFSQTPNCHRHSGVLGHRRVKTVFFVKLSVTKWEHIKNEEIICSSLQCSGSKYLTAKLEGSFCSFEPGFNLNYFKLKPTYNIKNLKIISIQKRYQGPVIKSKLLGHLNLFDNYSIRIYNLFVI